MQKQHFLFFVFDFEDGLPGKTSLNSVNQDQNQCLCPWSWSLSLNLSLSVVLNPLTAACRGTFHPLVHARLSFPCLSLHLLSLKCASWINCLTVALQFPATQPCTTSHHISSQCLFVLFISFSARVLFNSAPVYLSCFHVDSCIN